MAMAKYPFLPVVSKLMMVNPPPFLILAVERSIVEWSSPVVTGVRVV
jgi:hypothetical protein